MDRRIRSLGLETFSGSYIAVVSAICYTVAIAAAAAAAVTAAGDVVSNLNASE